MRPASSSRSRAARASSPGDERIRVDAARLEHLLDRRESALAVGQLVRAPVGRLSRFGAGARGRLGLAPAGLQVALLLDQRLLARGEALRLGALLLRLCLERGERLLARGNVALARDELVLVDAAPLELCLSRPEPPLYARRGAASSMRWSAAARPAPRRAAGPRSASSRSARGQLLVLEAALCDFRLGLREPLRLLGELALALGHALLLDAALLQLALRVGELPLALDERRDLEPPLGELLLELLHLRSRAASSASSTSRRARSSSSASSRSATSRSRAASSSASTCRRASSASAAAAAASRSTHRGEVGLRCGSACSRSAEARPARRAASPARPRRRRACAPVRPATPRAPKDRIDSLRCAARFRPAGGERGELGGEPLA